MVNKEEVASAWRKMANDALAVAIATESDDPLAIAMSLIEFRFSSNQAALIMRGYSQQKMGESGA